MNANTTETQMKVRRPVQEVFNAFIDPEVTSNFWFTYGSGKLETGKTVTWKWEMYQVETQVEVLSCIQNELIVIRWNDPDWRTVEFTFQSLAPDSTYITIKEFGYTEVGDELIAAIKDSTGGFTTVLDGLKAYLEHGIKLNLILDKFPPEVINHGK